MKSQKNIVLKMIKKQVRDIDPSAEIILYGSRARGDNRPDSVWDILILLDSKVDSETEKKFRHKLFDIELEMGEALSTFVYNKDEWRSKYWMTPFYKNVTKEGVAM